MDNKPGHEHNQEGQWKQGVSPMDERSEVQVRQIKALQMGFAAPQKKIA
jgi:hypothetical protein